jgi:DNA-binding response OmpR family regulator
MRIVILDDQPGLANTLALSLRHAGHTAHGFTDAIEALAAISEADVLLTDYHLTGLTGLDVARRAFEQGWRGSLLLMSGNPRRIAEPLEHPLLQLVMLKPFDTEELLEAISLTEEPPPSE